MKIRLTIEARDEFDAALDYLLERSEYAADGFLDDLERTKAVLLQFPRAGSPVGKGVRKFTLSRYPYNLIYRVEGEEIRVYAIAHHKLKPRYWRTRVP